MKTNGVSRQIQKLERLQATVTTGIRADRERIALMAEMYEQGMSQPYIANLLSNVTTSRGEPPVGVDAVQKAIKKYRSKEEG